MARWNKEDLFVHQGTKDDFEVVEVTVLQPNGRIGYTLKPVGRDGPVLRRFEEELESGTEFVLKTDTTAYLFGNPDKATLAAQALLDKFTIGTASRFCDESDFDSATVEEVAAIIRKVYEGEQDVAIQP